MDKYPVEKLDDMDQVFSRLRNRLHKKGKQIVTIDDYTAGSETRSQKQNRLSFVWYKHIAKEMEDDTPEGKRAYCKLHFGIPIRRENDRFRESYDRAIRKLSYEDKIEIMVGAIDFPVTRDMTVKEMARYLEQIEIHFNSIGVSMPHPEDIYFESLGIKRN